MKDNALVIQPMRWGLLPAHTTSIPHGPDALRTINARDDSVLSGQSMWTPLLRKGKRCVVFAQGFYEWLKKSDSSRVAHFVGMLDIGKGRTDVDGKQRALMPMAGLYERCVIDEQEMYSFTIITTESNRQLNFLHDRMPVILPDTLAIMTWLGARHASSREVCSLLKPYDAGDLEVYTVPREVGKVGNNDKSFILPVSSRKDGIAAAFGRAKKVEKDTNSETHAPLTEEVKAVETKRKRDQEDQEKVDEDLARKLQKQEEQTSKKVKQDEVERDVKVAEQLQENEGVAKGKASNTPKCDNAVMKEEEEKSKEKTEAKGNHLEPSSKFSPDPYNPPISPDRPQGGYSTAEHGNPETRGHIPHRKWAASPTKSAKLQEAAKGTKDIRNFFGGK